MSVNVSRIADEATKAYNTVKDKPKAWLEKEHAAAAAKIASIPITMLIMRRLWRTFGDLATKPTPEEKEMAKAAGIEVLQDKQVGRDLCFKGYKKESNFDSDFEDFSDGMFLTKGTKRYALVIVRPRESRARKYTSGTEVERFIESFSETIAVVKKLTSAGVTMKFSVARICFHTDGFDGAIIYECPKSVVGYNDYVSRMIQGEEWQAKNRKIALPIRTRVGQLLKKKMSAIHEAGVLYSVGDDFRWLSRSDILLNVDKNKTIKEVYILNYTNAALQEDLVKSTREVDMDMVSYLADVDNYDVERFSIDLAILKMHSAGVVDFDGR